MTRAAGFVPLLMDIEPFGGPFDVRAVTNAVPKRLRGVYRRPSTSAMKASVCSITSSVTDMCPRSS